MATGSRSSQSPPASSNAEEGQATPPETTPAVTARILKKRETDRKCQRMIRERTKSRIAYLEGLVEQFRQQDSSGRVETLMRQLSDVKEERDGLAKQVKTIENIVTGIKLKDEPGNRENSALTRLRANESMTTNIPSADHQWHPTAIHYEDASTPRSQDTPIYALYNKEYQSYIDARATWASAPTATPADTSCECSAHYPDVASRTVTNNWRYANDTLTEWFKWSPQVLDMTSYTPYNDDVPVRAIVEGWDAVEKRGHMHPIWRLLRGIDENIFGSCEPRERLSILTVMGLLLQAHVNPTAEQHRRLPSFYLKRPSQDMLHSYATEYFAWPSLRERFIFSEHRYCSNSFWRVFCQSLRLQWPYEFRDCYVHNIDTGLYRISPTFHERVSDIRCWTMGREMFKAYPELYGDIPAWNHIPASIAPYADVQRIARRALPSTVAVEAGSRQRRATLSEHSPEGDMHLNHAQPQPRVQLQIPAPTSQPIYYDYPTSATSTNFEAGADEIPHFGFQATSVVPSTSLTNMQQISPVHQWTFHGSLDVYPLNAT